MNKMIVPLIVAALLLASGLSGHAQSRSYRLAVIGAPEEPRFSEIVRGLKQGLHPLGYAEQAVEISELRVARKDRDKVAAMVKQLVDQRVEVLFLIGSRLVKPARESAPELPLV
ncbi:MAG: ABC transporter substrate binding protein, partial [Candidatus Binatia bacterium]